MTDEPNDAPLEEAIDNVELSEDDDLESNDYYDPEEDQDDEVTETDEGTDDEADEAETPEDETEGDDQEADDEPQASEIADDVLVSMPDGSTIKFGDLKESPMLKADHTRKTQELSTERKALQADTQRIQDINNAFVEHLAGLLPPEPNPSLALSDPNKFVAQKAQYDAALAQVQNLIQVGEQAKQVNDGMSEADRQKATASENSKLIEMFPVAGTDKRSEFFQSANQAALDLGFSSEELGAVTDHRMIAMAHWAQLGMKAQQATAKAKAKVQKAPPATPRKPGQGAKAANVNANAMRKLKSSGSIHDAVNVDWD